MLMHLPVGILEDSPAFVGCHSILPATGEILVGPIYLDLICRGLIVLIVFSRVAPCITEQLVIPRDALR